MVTTNGAEPTEEVDAPDEPASFEFSPAVKRAWESIEIGQRRTQIETLQTSRREALVSAMSNVRTSRSMLELKEDELEDRGPQIDPRERQARESLILQARLQLEDSLQTCDALAEELEALTEALQDLDKAGSRPMIGGSRATRRRRR